jgi:hypothetical protein
MKPCKLGENPDRTDLFSSYERQTSTINVRQVTGQALANPVYLVDEVDQDVLLSRSPRCPPSLRSGVASRRDGAQDLAGECLQSPW